MDGCPEQVKQLYQIMKELEDMPAPLVNNGFGNSWLGCLVKKLGREPEEVGCRGEWLDLELENDVLKFTTQSAWYRCTEVEELIAECFPEICIHFMCEEPGMAIYEKNDASGKYFPEEFIIDFEDDSMYYCTEQEALRLMSEFLDDDFRSMNDVMASISKYNENVDEEECEGYVQVHQISLIES